MSLVVKRLTLTPTPHLTQQWPQHWWNYPRSWRYGWLPLWQDVFLSQPWHNIYIPGRCMRHTVAPQQHSLGKKITQCLNKLDETFQIEDVQSTPKSSASTRPRSHREASHTCVAKRSANNMAIALCMRSLSKSPEDDSLRKLLAVCACAIGLTEVWNFYCDWEEEEQRTQR